MGNVIVLGLHMISLSGLFDCARYKGTAYVIHDGIETQDLINDKNEKQTLRICTDTFKIST